MNSYKIFIKNFSTKYSNFIGANPKYQPYNPYIDLSLEDKLKERYAKKLAFWEIQRKNFSTTPKRDNMNAYSNPNFNVPSYIADYTLGEEVNRFEKNLLNISLDLSLKEIN